jgi:hypothetical protein
MSTRPDLRPSAVASATVIRSDAGRRRSPTHSADQLERLSARMDFLIRDVRLGAQSHREHERHVEEAEAIATGIRAAFREPTPVRQINAPLKIEPGKVWF